MSEEESLSNKLSEICLSCGMCCDGTLFGHANLASAEDEALAVSLGLKVSLGNQEQRQFMLPCHHFCGKCTIYDNPRPKVCGSYFCAPLLQAKNGKRTFSSAGELIFSIKKLRDEVAEDLLSTPDLSELSIYQAFNKLSEDEALALKSYPKLWLKLIGLSNKLTELKKGIKKPAV